jgi:hypothetical protein
VRSIISPKLTAEKTPPLVEEYCSIASARHMRSECHRTWPTFAPTLALFYDCGALLMLTELRHDDAVIADVGEAIVLMCGNETGIGGVDGTRTDSNLQPPAQ